MEQIWLQFHLTISNILHYSNTITYTILTAQKDQYSAYLSEHSVKFTEDEVCYRVILNTPEVLVFFVCISINIAF